MLYIILFLIAVFPFVLLLAKGRKGHPGLKSLSKWAYAHRGLHGEGIPENSLKAFRRAAAEGYGAELDVHLLADGNVAVIHDSSLKRTAGVNVLIEDLTLSQLDNYYLQGTLETIPEFSQVLSIFENSAPLIIELKTQGDNYAQLCKAVCKHLDSYSGKYCIESFDARCVYWFRKNRPDVIRGQLASNFMKHGAVDKPWLLRFAATNHFLNFLTKPDFIAYRFSDRRNFFTWICRKLWEMQGVAWTITSKRDYQNAVKEGWIPIFEKIMP